MMEILREYECECYDDFYTKWFEITENYMKNSLVRASLLGFLAEKAEKGTYYITIQEDKWWCMETIDKTRLMDRTFVCKWFDEEDKYPVIRELKIENNWKKTLNRTLYYVSPETGWVYTFGKLVDMNNVETDMIYCMHDALSEKSFSDYHNSDGFEPVLVGWQFSECSKIPAEDMEEMIEEYENRKVGK